MYEIYCKNNNNINKTHFYRNMMKRQYSKERAVVCVVALHLLHANECETCLFPLQEG